MARFSGELVEDTPTEPKKPRFQGQTIDQSVPPAPTPSDARTTKAGEPSLMERGKEVLKQTGIGGVAGFFAPEILTGTGMAAAAFPVTAPAAPFLIGTGRALRGSRTASSAMGATSGLTGETAGQAVEYGGGTPGQAELARFVAGTFAPEIPRGLGTTAGTLIGRAAGALGVPGASRVTTVGQLLAREGVEPGSLTREQREFIQRKLDEVRGGAPSVKAQQEIAEMLRTGASTIMTRASSQADVLERQAAQEIQAAQAAAGRLDEQAQQRISNLQSQLETAADSIRVAAQGRANEINAAAQQRAKQVMDYAAQQTPDVQRIANIEAQDFIAKGRQEADKIISDANQKIARMRDVRGRLLQTGRARVAAATPQIGEVKTRTGLGEDIRGRFTSVLDRLKKVREEATKKNKGQAFGAALAKEVAGASFSQTQAAQEAVTNLNARLKSPLSGLSGVPEGTIRNQIENVRDTLQGFRRTRKEIDGNIVDVDVPLKPSFEQLEIIRRSLRDRASGLPAEGYDAINQGLAKDLANMVEAVQREFSPGFAKYLETYKELSKPVNKFANDLGQAITGKAEYDFAEFVFDPAGIADKVFVSDRGVKQLINTMGQAEAESVARSFIAARLGQGSAKEIDAVVRDSKIQDWIGNFPQLRNDLMQAASKRTTAESVAGRRESLARLLRTEMGQLPERMGRQATRAEQDAATEAARRLKAGEKQVAGIERAAATEAGKITTGAETTAARELAGAESQIERSAKSVAAQAESLRKEGEQAGAQGVKAAEARAGELTKEAQNIRNEAQKTANLITAGDKTGEARVRDLILSENEEELQETAKIILANPKGKQLFGEAIGQVLADLAFTSPKRAVERWKYTSEALQRVGLIDERLKVRLANDLQDVLVSPISAREKMTLVRSLFRNALTGYAIPGAERRMSGDNQAEEQDEDATR
jgi:hypothetical protein